MYRLNYQLMAREEAKNPVTVAVVGAGQQGRGMVSQMIEMKGMFPAVVADVNLQNAINIFKKMDMDNYIITKNPGEAMDAIKAGKYVLTEDMNLIAGVEAVNAVVDATGVPEVGARLAVDTIKAKKHIVMLNVETDVTIGSILKKMADDNGVVYTGSAGDEPGAVMEMYDFARAMGFEVRVIGKGQNHPMKQSTTPDMVVEEAAKFNMNPKMLCSFKDGTKTMVEMTAMANATGLVCDVRGSHGPFTDVAGLNKTFLKKDEGGILNNYGVVEYVNGVAPGVFAIIANPNKEIQSEMAYMRMGDGPNYTLFRPYHLCCLETPLSLAMAAIENKPTIVPLGRPVCDTVTVAKRDLKAGEYLDNIGGYTVHGVIEKHDIANELKALPLGLINKNTKMKRDVKLGEILTYDDVELDENSFILQLRREQDKLFK